MEIVYTKYEEHLQVLDLQNGHGTNLNSRKGTKHWFTQQKLPHNKEG